MTDENVSAGTADSAAANAGAETTGGAESGTSSVETGASSGVETGGAEKVAGSDKTSPGPGDQPNGAQSQGEGEGSGDNTGDEQTAGRLQELRALLAGSDDKFLKQLERYKTPESLARGLREAYNLAKESGGKNKAVARPGEKATPEEIKAFREAAGIPDDPSEYPVSWREEFKASERDNQILDDVKAFAVERNIDPKVTSDFLSWYEDLAVGQRQQLDENLASVAKQTQNALTAEWGPEYKGNIAGVQELLKTHMGADGADQFYNLRLADGSRIQDHQGIVKMLAGIASDYYGANAIIVGDVEAAGQSTQQQLDDLMQLRVKDPEKYHSADVQAKVNALFARKAKLDGRK